MLNAASGHLSIQYGLRGPNYAVATACASATNAMGDAFKAIQYDDADVMVTGGTEAAMHADGPRRLSQHAGPLRRGTTTRTEASRPFDADRDGFVLSEGAGILVFEELEHAKARGGTIYAEVLGYGASADAGHITQPDERGHRRRAGDEQRAPRRASSIPTDIDYINAHGTSTPLGDKAETHGHQERLRRPRPQGQHLQHQEPARPFARRQRRRRAGDLRPGASATSVVPPTINLDTPDPDCDLDYTPQRAARAAASTPP